MSFDCFSYVDSINELVGKTFGSVQHSYDKNQLTFNDIDGKPMYRMEHDQDCCENVYLDEIIGDLRDLEGTPILVAECVSNRDNPQSKFTEDDDEYWLSPESETWTFYKFSTIKGSVTLRWYGSSNGFYSEGVDIKKWSMDDE